MTAVLATRTPEVDVDRFRREGYLAPVPVLPRAEAAALKGRYEALCAAEGGELSAATRKKPHLLLTHLADLVRDPRIVGPVSAILGPDVLCWSSIFFAKSPGQGSYVAWHQDATFWGLSKPSIVTAWVAFTPSTKASGCLRVVPGSHLKSQLPHRATGRGGNMLSRDQEIAVEVDEGEVVDLELQPGEMSIHHVMLIHGSEPNRADHPRIGYAIRYIAGDVRQLTPVRDSATLVAGRDLGHFDIEPRPKSDFDPDAVAYHRWMLDQQTRIGAAMG